MSRSGRLETDFLADGVGQCLENSGVFHEHGFNSGKALGGFLLILRGLASVFSQFPRGLPLVFGHFSLGFGHPALRFGDLSLTGRLSLNEKRLCLDERPQRLVEFVPVSVAFAATFGHATTPTRESSSYRGNTDLRDETISDS